MRCAQSWERCFRGHLLLLLYTYIQTFSAAEKPACRTLAHIKIRYENQIAAGVRSRGVEEPRAQPVGPPGGGAVGRARGIAACVEPRRLEVRAET